jgi:hypothetical protein
LWLISAIILFSNRQERHARLLPTLIANALFPLVLLAAALRGQEIQGARYLVWAFFFSTVWNLLELWHIDETASAGESTMRHTQVFAGFLVLCLLSLPFESHYFYRVLTVRKHTMKLFMSQNIAEVLRGKHGIASDVGYISYFSQDPVCDLAGLVNGRAAASLSRPQRIKACMAEHPDFVFVSTGQIGELTTSLDFAKWQICGQYDMGNLTTLDRHFLIVKPELVAATCKATGYTPVPESHALVEAHYN